jgi:hypothetical protein
MAATIGTASTPVHFRGGFGNIGEEHQAKAADDCTKDAVSNGNVVASPVRNVTFRRPSRFAFRSATANIHLRGRSHRARSPDGLRRKNRRITGAGAEIEDRVTA